VIAKRKNPMRSMPWIVAVLLALPLQAGAQSSASKSTLTIVQESLAAPKLPEAPRVSSGLLTDQAPASPSLPGAPKRPSVPSLPQVAAVPRPPVTSAPQGAGAGAGAVAAAPATSLLGHSQPGQPQPGQSQLSQSLPGQSASAPLVVAQASTAKPLHTTATQAHATKLTKSGHVTKAKLVAKAKVKSSKPASLAKTKVKASATQHG
jgi:hypothetical protein